MAGGVYVLTGEDAVSGRIPQNGMNPKANNFGIPKFELVPIKLADGSYANVEYVQILIPGDNRNSPYRKVTDGLRQRYAAYYDQWRKGLEMAPDGTPLEMWPVVTPAQVFALKAVNVFTVEQLANVSDANLHQLPFGRTLRNQARAWLETKEKTDVIERQEAANQALQDGMRQMQEQLAALAQQNSDLQMRLQVTEQIKGAPPQPVPQTGSTWEGPASPDWQGPATVSEPKQAPTAPKTVEDTTNDLLAMLERKDT